MVIPADLMVYKNKQFVFHDTGPSRRRIIIFTTPDLLEVWLFIIIYVAILILVLG